MQNSCFGGLHGQGGFQDICTKPAFSEAALPSSHANHCLEEVFVEDVVDLGHFQSHLEAL